MSISFWKNWVKTFKSFFFFSTIFAWSAATAPVGWFLFVLQRFSGSVAIRRWARTANWAYGRIALWLIRPFIKIRCINPQGAKHLGSCILVCNHQSILDLYLLSAQDCRQPCPVTKSWPFKLLFPFAPGMLAAGYVQVEGRTAQEVHAQCRQRLSEGAALVFYPEGRRSRDNTLGKFHAGAFKLALEENVPIVPIVIRNSGKAIRPGSLVLEPCPVEMELLPPIMPEGFAAFRCQSIPHRALLRYVRGLYKTALTQEESYED